MNQSKAYGGVIDCALRKRKETENNMFIKETVKGMRDILPAEMEVREYLLARLKAVYTSFGYTPIETPCMERIENLTNKQGGENEKLIFKVLKRGEKLAEAAETADPDDLCDAGMRYDLTVPLSRYYANNAGSLPAPFKALQVGSVWRADRPQKGRFRQQSEFIVWGSNSAMPVNRPVGCLPGVFRYTNPQNRIHVTEKPLQLMRDIVKICEPGGRILDPFAGAGTTVLAAVREGYEAVGIEVTDAYFKLGSDRVQFELENSEA